MECQWQTRWVVGLTRPAVDSRPGIHTGKPSPTWRCNFSMVTPMNELQPIPNSRPPRDPRVSITTASMAHTCAPRTSNSGSPMTSNRKSSDRCPYTQTFLDGIFPDSPDPETGFQELGIDPNEINFAAAFVPDLPSVWRTKVMDVGQGVISWGSTWGGSEECPNRVISRGRKLRRSVYVANHTVWLLTFSSCIGTI